jgi:hypothetical protein
MCVLLNGSDRSPDSEWRTSANYFLAEVGQND